MKKFILCLLGVLSLYGVSNAIENCYQQYGSYYDVSKSTSYAVNVSSTATTTFAGDIDLIERIFTIPTESSNKLYFQRGGTSSTAVTNGLVLNNNTYYVDDTYFGNIYFKSTGGVVPLRVTILKKTA